MTRDKWEVIAGNVGTVYAGCNRHEAELSYQSYWLDSANGYGRVAGESVYLVRDGEIVREFTVWEGVEE